MKYLLLEQKYLELLSQKNRMEALKVYYLSTRKVSVGSFAHVIPALTGSSDGVDPIAPQAGADPRAFQLPDALQTRGHIPSDEVRGGRTVETRSHGPPAGVPACLNHAATQATCYAYRTSR